MMGRLKIPEDRWKKLKEIFKKNRKNVIKQMHGKTQTRINNHQSRGRWYFCGEF